MDVLLLLLNDRIDRYRSRFLDSVAENYGY